MVAVFWQQRYYKNNIVSSKFVFWLATLGNVYEKNHIYILKRQKV